MAKKFWNGSEPTRCDVTGRAITDEFIDGKTRMGPWGIMHPTAHAMHGVGVGIGRGQRYRKDADGRWRCVEGGSR